MSRVASRHSLFSSLKTGVGAIDDEHQALLALHQRLTECCSEVKVSCVSCSVNQRGQCAHELFAIYEELINLMSSHFSHEESLMAGCPADWVAGHKFEHAELAEKIVAVLHRKPSSRDFITPTELFDLIFEWLEDHIMRWDIPLADLLLGRPSTSS